MKIQIVFLFALFLTVLTPTLSQAESFSRRLADSEYDIAQKAYRSAIKKYGENLQGLPAAEKESACKKIGWGLFDNRLEYQRADPFTMIRYKRQVEDLTKYNEAFGCTR